MISKEAKQEYDRQRYVKNREQMLAHAKEKWANMTEAERLKRRKYFLGWYARNKDRCRLNSARWEALHPRYNLLAKFARSKANQIISIKGKCCELCRNKLKLERHHPDYSQPLNVVILCHKCHQKLHIKLRRNER